MKSKVAREKLRYRYANDPEYRASVKARARAWYKKNKERAHATRRKWYEANRVVAQKYNREYYLKCMREDPEARRKYAREYAAKTRHKPERQKTAHVWRVKNKAKLRVMQAEHARRSRRELTDAYVRRYLRSHYKIENPTPEQISHRRMLIMAKRNNMIFQLNKTVSALCNSQ